ncbi:MAG TPA: hypothetical protein VFF04_06640 [Candidatus Babeliales bacterium]|nr:hypothetical protein [Candidatus Babeliales bacterium]
MKIQTLVLSLSLICSNLIGSESEHGHSHGAPISRVDSGANLHEDYNQSSWRQTLRSPYHFFNYTWTGYAVQLIAITRLSQLIASEGISGIPGVSWFKSTFLGHSPKHSRTHDHEFNAALQVTLLEHAETQAKLWNTKVTELKDEEALLLEKLKTSSAGSAQHTQLNQELEALRKLTDLTKQSRDKATKQHQELFDDAMQNRSKLSRPSHANTPIATKPTPQPLAKKIQLPHQHQHSPACGHGHAHGGHAH